MPDVYLTAAEAADRFALRSSNVVHNWSRRGLLQVQRRNTRGGALYSWQDLCEVERATRSTRRSKRHINSWTHCMVQAA